MSVGTAFFERQRELNTKLSWGDWSGYHAAAVFADFVDIEYNAIREAAAVIDVTPLYKYEVSGADAATLLDRVVTRDVSQVALDQVIYTPWCDEEGKVIDDGTVTRLAQDRFRVTAADPSYRWFAMNATGLDVRIDDISQATAGTRAPGAAVPPCAGEGNRPGLVRPPLLPASTDDDRRASTSTSRGRATRVTSATSSGSRSREPSRSGTGCSRSAPTTASGRPASRLWTSAASRRA